MTAIIIKHTKEHYVPNKPGGLMRLTGAALNFEGGLLLFQILRKFHVVTLRLILCLKFPRISSRGKLEPNQ